MDERVLTFDEPEMEGNRLRVGWRIRYSKAGLPDLVIDGVETAVFEGERIAMLRDDFEPEAEATLQAWLAENGDRV